MNPTETHPSPTNAARSIETLRRWFRERHAPRDRRHARRPGERDFAITEWADTEAAMLEPATPLRTARA